MATKTARAVWQKGMDFEGVGGSGNRLMMSSVAKEGEQSTGFSPMELVLVGFAGCTGMDVISILEKKRQKVTSFEVQTAGERAAEHPMVYTDIQIEYIVHGYDINPEAVARAIELTETKYCSVSAMLSKTARITTSYKIVEEPQIEAVTG
ncbi:MAG: OsmC family peroxiredoxin [Chloroflexi bacterium]|nr:OsmC family peroxiredoxin [Chloroflexota bacterium]